MPPTDFNDHPYAGDTRPEPGNRQLACELADGTFITLPVRAWMDQRFVRNLFAHTGNPIPEFDDDDWLDLVFLMLEHAEVA